MGASVSACHLAQWGLEVETDAPWPVAPCSEPALRVGPSGSIPIYNLDLHGGDVSSSADELRRYYAMCSRATGLHVTTSCFTSWRQHKKTNAYGKAIPTARVSSAPGRPCRVFFFDDNLELDGLEGSSGICSLRDVESGEFVDFAPGRNGFELGHAGRHTAILHSREYNSVLVKANILDAIEDPDYFTRIVREFSAPGEKVVVFMDVNSTIVCNDSVQSKDLSASLLSTMFELMELSPRAGFEFAWGSCPPVSVQKKQSLKKLVKDITASNGDAYRSFFSEATCRGFMSELLAFADIRWSDALDPLGVDDFVGMFNEYRGTISGGIDSNGITQSWFRCFDALSKEHALMLNSFGVDTRKVILATSPDESSVTQIVVNYELWDKRDVEKFEKQFADAA
jgi:hypothetical protein